jgi:hypothetical protein
LSISSSTARGSASPGTTRETTPSSSASSADKSSPESKSSIARERPMMRGKRYVPPMLPTTPRRTKYEPIFARSDAMRMSHRSAKSMPMPTAAPLIAAIVGFVQLRIAPTTGVAAPSFER